MPDIQNKYSRERFTPKENPAPENIEVITDAPVEIVGINFREAGKIYYFSLPDTSSSLATELLLIPLAELK